MLYSIGWNKTPITPIQRIDNYTKFSIIIPARNEAQNIKNVISSILSNDYPLDNIEIIVIDDFSEDDTQKIAQNTFDNYAYNKGKIIPLSTLNIDDKNFKSYKKKAIELAITNASYKHIITIDADCIVDKNWLNSYNYIYSNQAETSAIIGAVNFTPYNNIKNALYYLQSIDFMTMQGITVASHKLNLGNMCNGANFSYTKDSFMAVNGFKDIDNLASGDDMMLLNKFHKTFPHNIAYIKNTANIVHTPVQPTWKSFLNQRVRWASKNGKYKDYRLNSILITVYLFNCSILCFFILCLFQPQNFIKLGGILFAKYLIEFLFIYKVSKFFNKRNELIYHLLMQPVHILYVITTGFLGLFHHYEWKGRIVKNKN